MNAEPTLRQLRHFLSLAEHCHFGHAADACFVTQSTLSASIKELESILGTRLFERTKRSVMVTEAGADLVDRAKDICLRLDDFMDAARSTAAPLSGDLRMGVIPTIGPFLLPRVLSDLRDTYPELRLYLREEPTGALLRKLNDGVIDLALMALPYETEKTESFIFADDPFMTIFPRGHAMGDFETMTPTRLQRDALLLLEEGNCLTEQTLAMGNGRSNGKGKATERIHPSQFQATSLHTLAQMVSNGLGIAVLPKMAVDAGILRGLKVDFRPFSSPKATRQIALVWRKTSQRGEEFRLLGHYLRDELGTPLRRPTPG